MLVVIALSFSMAIMTSLPASISANQLATEQLNDEYQSVLGDMENEIATTMTLIECRSGISWVSREAPSNEGTSAGGMPSIGIVGGEEVYINETTVQNISQIEGVKAVLPFLEKSDADLESQETQDGGGIFVFSIPNYTIRGVPLNSSLLEEYAVLPTNIIEGRTLQEGDSGVVLLSKNNTEYFGAGVGDTITIANSTFEVVGIYDAPDNLNKKKVYMALSDAQEVTGLEGQVNQLDVYAEDKSQVDDIAAEIQQLYPEIELTTYEERLSRLESTQEMYESMLENSESTLAQTQAVAYQEIGIAMVATSLIVLFTMLYTVRERTHEIGVLKAIGFSNGSIMSQLMMEGIFMSVIAGIIGVAIGSVATPLLSSVLLPAVNPRFGGGPNSGGSFISDFGVRDSAFQSSIAATVNPQIMLLSFILAIVLGAVGTLYPAWRASRTSPMEALKYE
jgi:putative ABC transport system permease protein